MAAIDDGLVVALQAALRALKDADLDCAVVGGLAIGARVRPLENNAAPGRDLLVELDAHLQGVRGQSRDPPVSKTTFQRLTRGQPSRK